MTKNINLIIYIFSLLIFVNCSNDDDNEGDNTQSVTTFSEKGLLGQSILIEGENFEPNMIRVLFDNQQAIVQNISETQLMAIVPRSIERYNPVLRVIDLNDNSELLNATFFLETPSITGYSSNEITFDEILTVEGEFFDNLDDAVKVKVNGEFAQIVDVSYENIQIKIPYNITYSELEIKVEAQLQEVTSMLNLNLKAPIISNHEGDGVYWSQSNGLVINGSNFNPNSEYGKVLVNGINCFFFSTNNQLFIDLPPGPYQDFNINEVEYETGGQTVIYNQNIPILDDKIMVDYSSNNINHTLFEFNGFVYGLRYPIGGFPDESTTYTLSRFDPELQSWSEFDGNYTYTGIIDDALFDGNHSLYLYKRNPNTFEYFLSKLDLITLDEVAITMPFNNNITGPILIPYQENLYFLSGLIYYDGVPVTVTDKYKYNSITGIWEQLSDDAFSELPLISSFPPENGKISYLHYNDKLYFNYSIGALDEQITYELNPDLTITQYNHNFYFEYNGFIFGGNYSYNDVLYNIQTSEYINIPYGFLGNNFFKLNNSIYFHQNSSTAYYQNTLFTYKLRTSFLNDLLN